MALGENLFLHKSEIIILFFLNIRLGKFRGILFFLLVTYPLVVCGNIPAKQITRLRLRLIYKDLGNIYYTQT